MGSAAGSSFFHSYADLCACVFGCVDRRHHYHKILGAKAGSLVVVPSAGNVVHGPEDMGEEAWGDWSVAMFKRAKQIIVMPHTTCAASALLWDKMAMGTEPACAHGRHILNAAHGNNKQTQRILRERLAPLFTEVTQNQHYRVVHDMLGDDWQSLSFLTFVRDALAVEMSVLSLGNLMRLPGVEDGVREGRLTVRFLRWQTPTRVMEALHPEQLVFVEVPTFGQLAQDRPAGAWSRFAFDSNGETGMTGPEGLRAIERITARGIGYRSPELTV